MKVIWNDSLLAESNNTVVVEGNHCFPAESLERAYFQDSDKTTHRPWKGDAGYYTVVE